MSALPRLVLKQSTGWFAAGWQFGEAMLTLSDAAFTLFAWLCLNADRHTGRVGMPVPEIARALRRTESWTQAALHELEERGVCRCLETEQLEVTDGYWPYEKQPSGSGPQEYIAQVRKLLSEPACVRCRFTPADEKLARDLHRRGVTVAQIERAIWLGCARKYTTLLANGAAWMPIASLSYFTAVIDEVVCQTNTPDSYWTYIRRQARELEKQWMTCTRSLAGPSAR
jgi:hypothetical protein